ncbi:hypothetical protein N7670_09795 [Stenotrophomonas maltophilia]|uniref:hypothetical protein n=1 Tax=Stenotrophomonas maltophilia TaxID=40324 RepID=UPI0024474C18|nr:hypothetical protein [Stenotrophomonas maltophilia]MDG9939677.1 hypothetical protein [Stenotrophomonas maltophilia]MDH0559504.1 hypothetical protein [Stenotrophomonas maltophilia]
MNLEQIDTSTTAGKAEEFANVVWLVKRAGHPPLVCWNRSEADYFAVTGGGEAMAYIRADLVGEKG